MKQAACYEAAICILSILREEDLDLLELSSSTRVAIREARTDDDFVGKGVAGFLTHLGSFPLTYQDRVVAVQAMGVGCHAILKGSSVTKYLFDRDNILQALPLFKQISAISPDDPAVGALRGDAFDENMEATMTYISQYNRDIIDYTKRWTASGAPNDMENPTDKPWWKDMFALVGINVN